MMIELTPAPALPSLNDPATFNARALALFSWLTGTHIPELEGISSQDLLDILVEGSAVQSSTTDATVDRLMKVGAFGVGGNAGSSHLTNYEDASGVSQLIGDAVSATPADKPVTGRGHAGVHIATSGNRWFQLMAQVAGSGSGKEQMFFRRSYNGDLNDWREVFHQGSILGAVSESSGVPTGAIIERGSNANGEYVKFADGTLICTNQAFDTSTSADVTWTYPHQFVYPASPGRPAVSGSASATPATAAFLSVGGIANGSSVAVRAVDLSGARQALGCSLTAIGRWY